MKKSDIKNCIIIEMAKYSWPKQYKIDCKYDFLFEVIFPKSIIRFIINDKYCYVDCNILNPLMLLNERGFENKYPIDLVLETLNSKKSKLYNELDSRIRYKDYIEQFIKLIHKDLLSVIKGDFSWHNRFKEINNNSLEIYNIMKEEIKTNEGRKIYDKMLANDFSWIKDLENWKSNH